MKLPLLLALAGALLAAALAWNSGLLTARPEAEVQPLVRVAQRIDGFAVAAASRAPLPEGAFDPAFSVDDPDSSAAPADDGSIAPLPARLDLAVPDPFSGDAFGRDPLGGGLDPSMLLSAEGHVGRAAPSGAPVPEGVVLLTWEDIALPDYEPPTPFEEEQYTKEEIFPAQILAHSGQSRALEGFMQPISWVGDRVQSFLLSPYPPGCCFGGMPGFDEWVEVEVADPKGAEFFAYRTVRVTGTFEVGESFDDYGYLSSIYRFRGDQVERLW